MNNSDYINGILKYIRGLSSINYQNAVGCILSIYYEGAKTYEMPSPYGGDDKNDGWVVEDALFYQIFSYMKQYFFILLTFFFFYVRIVLSV